MASIYTNDGKYLRQVYNLKDAIQEVEENYSNDLAEYLVDKTEDFIHEKEYEFEVAKEEFRNYEISLENAQRTLSDTAENLQALIENVVNANRLNRESIITVLTNTVSEIMNEV